MEQANNIVELIGTLEARPEFSHVGKGENYYIFPINIERLSGTVDTINVITREELLKQTELTGDEKISVKGELRSFNNKSGVGNKLIITVFAQEIGFENEEDKNYIELYGTLCRTPNYRKTPMGREICDLMLAVNRRYGRSDYLPCIAWGRNAARAAELSVGDEIHITGRVQSRRYIKSSLEGPIEKTAYEVSVVELESCDE